ncbi:MAG: archease [Candidatus Nanoarchaeia archaeon]|nr:archease [Candidatus Nanoarchaeia archaeon]MDD5588056.1 archease [Candidatus Nanoarchaeia archaeon]
MKYKFLEHKADAKFQAFGKSLEEAFSNAALAMTSIMISPELVESKITKKITASGKDKKALLYNFLEQFLVLLDIESFILHEVKNIKITGNKLTAEVVGDLITDKYSLKSDVKAVTYNHMEIKEKPYIVQVVVDI